MIYDTRHKLVRRAMQQRLAEHEHPDLTETIELVVEDPQAMETVLMGLLSPQLIYRANCLRVVLAISEQQPKALYAEVERFTAMLNSSINQHRADGMQILVNILCAGGESHQDLAGILTALLDLLDGDSLPIARQMVQHAGKIALARPDLQEQITARLLAIDETQHTLEHKALLKADILQAFAQYYAKSADQARILAFAQALADSKSPKAKKAANAFIKLYN